MISAETHVLSSRMIFLSLPSEIITGIRNETRIGLYHRDSYSRTSNSDSS